VRSERVRGERAQRVGAFAAQLADHHGCALYLVHDDVPGGLDSGGCR